MKWTQRAHSPTDKRVYCVIIFTYALSINQETEFKEINIQESILQRDKAPWLAQSHICRQILLKGNFNTHKLFCILSAYILCFYRHFPPPAPRRYERDAKELTAGSPPSYDSIPDPLFRYFFLAGGQRCPSPQIANPQICKEKVVFLIQIRIGLPNIFFTYVRIF